MEIGLEWLLIENLILIISVFLFFLLFHLKTKSKYEKSKASLLNEKKLLEDQLKNLSEKKHFVKEGVMEVNKQNEILAEKREKEIHENKKLIDELNKTKEEYEKLNILIETVSTLLNGKKTENLKEIEKIKKVEKFIKNEFIPQIDELNILQNEFMQFSLLLESFNQWKLTQLKGWVKEKLNISLIGKFSSGKSSVINSLLKNSLLPIDNNPTTAVPTFVVHGYNNGVYYEDSEGNIREIDVQTFKNINYVTLKDFPISFFIKYFVLFIDISSFKDVNILDTPGFCSDNEFDRQRSIESINSSDVVFYVVDINDGTITDDAITFLKEIKNENLYVILNKCDTKPFSECQKVKSHIIKILDENKIKCEEVIIYSSRKNINNCSETLINLINNLKINKKNEKTFFDTMVEMTQTSIRKLKQQYGPRTPQTKANKIEADIKILSELLNKTKILKREVL